MPKLQKASPWPFIGMAGMASALFLYVMGAVVVPWFAGATMLLVWLVLFVLCCRWWTPYPMRLPFIALFAVVFWFAAMNAGASWLDWSS